MNQKNQTITVKHPLYNGPMDESSLNEFNLLMFKYLRDASLDKMREEDMRAFNFVYESMTKNAS